MNELALLGMRRHGLVASSTQPRVVAVVLNWNRWRDTERCIRSLAAQTYEALDVIIVDNHSADDSVTQLMVRFPEYRLVANLQNYGFGKGCNYGIRMALDAGADYIWLLNNDAVATPAALSELVARSSSDSAVGQTGSAIYDFDDWSNCLAWGGGSVNMLLGRAKHYSSPIAESELQFLTGASLLIPSHILNAVGLFDESFFLYWEDVDLSFRIRKAGFKLAVAPKSVVYHAESSSLGNGNPKLDRVYSASAKRFFLKHSRLFIVSITMNFITRCLNRARKGEGRRLWGTIFGFFD